MHFDEAILAVFMRKNLAKNVSKSWVICEDLMGEMGRGFKFLLLFIANSIIIP